MKELVKLKYATYYLDIENSILKEHWTNENEMMNLDDFKSTIIHFRDFINQYHLKNALVDTRKFGFVINPELQIWVDNEIMSKINHKMKKIAFLLPNDIFEQISIEQTVEEDSFLKGSDYLKKFDDLDTAYTWLKQQIN